MFENILTSSVSNISVNISSIMVHICLQIWYRDVFKHCVTSNKIRFFFQNSMWRKRETWFKYVCRRQPSGKTSWIWWTEPSHQIIPYLSCSTDKLSNLVTRGCPICHNSKILSEDRKVEDQLGCSCSLLSGVFGTPFIIFEIYR